MTDLQGYLTILTGFFVAFMLRFSGKPLFQRALLQILFGVLWIKISYYSVKILLTPINKGPVLKVLLSYKYIPDMAFLGLFLGAIAACSLNTKRSGGFYEFLTARSATYGNLLIAAVCITYILSAISAMTNFTGWLTFFNSCGYNKNFLILVIVMEVAGGLGVIFIMTRKPALFILTADMAGATYTHFHNYFTWQIPDPLGNALPSLAMLSILATLMILRNLPDDRRLKGMKSE